MIVMAKNGNKNKENDMKTILLTSLIAMTFLAGCGDEEFSAKHNQGRNCLECHGFTSGATIFSTANAANYDETKAAREYNIQLLLPSGETIRYSKGNGYGNFKYSGDKTALESFRPQVIDANGTVVNQALNMHSVDRLACNRCHTQAGSNGAPGRITNYDFYK